MKIHRLPLYFLALALPIVVVVLIARIALPPTVQDPAKNSTAIVELPADSPRIVPEKLDAAKQMAVDRLLHLQKLSQKEWDEERKTIMYKNPPEEIGAAIARTQTRIADLNQMTQEEWEKDRQRILRAEQARLKK